MNERPGRFYDFYIGSEDLSPCCGSHLHCRSHTDQLRKRVSKPKVWNNKIISRLKIGFLWHNSYVSCDYDLRLRVWLVWWYGVEMRSETIATTNVAVELIKETIIWLRKEAVPVFSADEGRTNANVFSQSDRSFLFVNSQKPEDKKHTRQSVWNYLKTSVFANTFLGSLSSESCALATVDGSRQFV